MGKSSDSGKSEVWDYHGTIAGAVCVGTVHELIAVIVDGAEVWPKAPAWTVGTSVPVNELRCFGGRTWKCRQTHATLDANAPSATSALWQAYALARDLGVNGGNWDALTIAGYGTLIIYWGTDTQTVPVLLTAAGNDLGEGHPDYQGVCYVILKDFLFGRERVSAPNVEIVVGRPPGQSLIVNQNGRSPASLNDGQANVLATVAEVLTSDLGLGLALSRLATSTFQAAAEILDAQASLCACSPVLDQQTTLRGWMADLENLADVFLRFNPATQKIEAGVWTHGVTPAQFATLTPDDLTEMPQFEAQSWQAAKTRGVVQFSDRARAFKQSSDSAEDARLFAILGEHRQLSLQRPAITRRAQALAHAAESLRSIGAPQFTGTVSVRREKARAIRPGDWVQLDIDLEPGGTRVNQFFRVKAKTTPRRGPCKLSLLADTALAPLTYTEAEAGAQEPDLVLPPITRARILEAPVALANYQAGQVLALAQRPDPTLTGFQVYFTDDNAGAYQLLGQARAFAAYATLRADLAAGDPGPLLIAADPAQVDLALLTETPSALSAANDDLLAILVKTSGGFVGEDAHGYCEIEVCAISALANPAPGNYDLTILRGRQKTENRSFAVATTEVWIMARSSLAPTGHAGFETLRQNRIAGSVPALGYFKLPPFTQSRGLDLDACPEMAFQWPASSAAGPVLTLTAPAADPASTAGPYPAQIPFAGTWSDPTGDVTDWKLTVKPSGGGETLVAERSFTPTEAAPFSQVVTISGPGTYYVYLRAWDISGLKTERVFAIVATGTNPKVAAPEFWVGSRKILSPYDKGITGPIELRCATPGASIKWRYGTSGAWLDYDPTTVAGTPYSFPDYLVTSSASRDFSTGAVTGVTHGGSIGIVTLQAYALKTDFADSAIGTGTIWHGMVTVMGF